MSDDEEAKGVDYLAKEILEDVELIDTGCVDTDGNKIVIVQRIIDHIGFIRFAKAFD